MPSVYVNHRTLQTCGANVVSSKISSDKEKLCKLQTFSVCNIGEAAFVLFLMSVEEGCFKKNLELTLCNSR